MTQPTPANSDTSEPIDLAREAVMTESEDPTVQALLSNQKRMVEALEEARDLLLERIQGSPARSAGHNARLVIEGVLRSVAESGGTASPKSEGPRLSEIEQRARGETGYAMPIDLGLGGPLAGACEWPAGMTFGFHDAPGEHDPCYVVMPDGAMLPFNHHAGPGVDIARARFVQAACNRALSEPPAIAGGGVEPSGSWRPEVRAFADLMEATLKRNDHKGGWKGMRPGQLWERCREELTELIDAIEHAKSYDSSDRGARLGPVHLAGVIGREAADVANFAMMIADVCGALTPPLVGFGGTTSCTDSADAPRFAAAGDTPCKSDWVTVPREPTGEMVQAGFNHTDASEFTAAVDLAENVYRAMIQAAPQPKGRT